MPRGVECWRGLCYFDTVSTNKHVHRFVTNDFTLRASVVNSTAVIQEMQKLQNAFAIPAVAVGRAMTGALLMAAQLKEKQQVGLLFRGNGSLAQVYAEATFEGQVRGYTPYPQYEPPTYEPGLSLKKHIGYGTMTVARHVPFQKQPYQGTIEMVSGEIGEDIANYLSQSQQIRSIVSLGVYVNREGIVQSAGGVILEVMPGVEDSLVEVIQKNTAEMFMPISELFLDGATENEILAPYLQGIPYTELDHDHPISYSCPCTKDRVFRALEVLGIAELEDMIEKDEKADITCQMCGRPYQISIVELEELKENLRKNSMH
ncbi:MAG: Hsp33 family molecular chaperone HslO [Pseudobdellovibrionaceae bacterium]